MKNWRIQIIDRKGAASSFLVEAWSAEEALEKAKKRMAEEGAEEPASIRPVFVP